MSSKNINILANIVLPIVVVITTVSLFFLFKPKEPTSLFYINMVYTVLLEAIFFGYLNFIHSGIKSLSTPFYAVFGIMAMYYITAGCFCMFIYSLLLVQVFSLNIYVTVLILLTLFWIIIATLTAQTDSNYKRTVDELYGKSQGLEFYTQKIHLLASRYRKICEEKGLLYKTDSNNQNVLDKLKGKISFLTPNIFANDMANSQLNTILEKCELIIDEMESTGEEGVATLEKKMQRFVDNSIAELDMLKNTTRK